MQQKRIHTALHDIQQKVFDEVQVIIADFGGGNAQRRKYSASKSAALCFVSFFWASKRKKRRQAK
jgi:hypothetical protein